MSSRGQQWSGDQKEDNSRVFLTAPQSVTRHVVGVESARCGLRLNPEGRSPGLLTALSAAWTYHGLLDHIYGFYWRGRCRNHKKRRCNLGTQVTLWMMVIVGSIWKIMIYVCFLFIYFSSLSECPYSWLFCNFVFIRFWLSGVTCKNLKENDWKKKKSLFGPMRKRTASVNLLSTKSLFTVNAANQRRASGSPPACLMLLVVVWNQNAHQRPASMFHLYALCVLLVSSLEPIGAQLRPPSVCVQGAGVCVRVCVCVSWVYMSVVCVLFFLAAFILSIHCFSPPEHERSFRCCMLTNVRLYFYPGVLWVHNVDLVHVGSFS